MAAVLMFFSLIFTSLSAMETTKDNVIDHGVFGTLFEIEEEDMIEVLKNKLQKLKDSGELTQIEADMKAKAKEKLANPAPVSGLKPTEEERQFIHDPTLTIENDITNHEGQVLARKGDKLNPLKFHKPSQGLLFIDGDDEKQLLWAKEHKGQYIITLVKGKPLELEEALGVPVYFDQGGHLCKIYNIKQIPARVEVTGEVLTITEFKVSP